MIDENLLGKLLLHLHCQSLVDNVFCMVEYFGGLLGLCILLSIYVIGIGTKYIGYIMLDENSLGRLYYYIFIVKGLLTMPFVTYELIL